MCNIVIPQDRKVARSKILRVANLDRKSEPAWQPAKKRCQQFQEVPHRCVGMAELKYERRALVTILLQRPQKRIMQKVRVQKRVVRQSTLGTVARNLRERPASNLFRHFEGELKRFRNLREQALPEGLARKLVERKIPTNRRKCFGVFAQAGLVKQLL